MRNGLERLLDLACTEPAYGPEFYRCLLDSEVFGLIPKPKRGRVDGVVRFVTWTDLNSTSVIPCFSSRAIVRRAITPKLAAITVLGRSFLEATRGSTVVLNPNQTVSCRLSPSEVGALLETGAVSRPERVRLAVEQIVAFTRPHNPPVALIHSLVILYSRHANVESAYLVIMYPESSPEQRAYLVGVQLAPGSNGEPVARESAAVMQDVPPDLSTDLMVFKDSQHPTLQAIARIAHPFYDRAVGSRIVKPTSGQAC